MWPLEVLEVEFLLPMGLDEDAVDGIDADGLVGVADRLEHAGETEIAGPAQNAVGRADDQFESRLGKSVVPETYAIELAMNEGAHVIGIEPFGDDGVSDPALNVLVDGEGQVTQQGRLADEDEVVILG